MTVLLAACTVPGGLELAQRGHDDLAAAPICCKSLATAERLPLPLKPADVTIDAKVQAFDFGGDKAFFVLYELPVYSGPYSIVISSLGAGNQADIALFAPRAALYDDRFNVTRAFDDKTLRTRGNTLERTVFINPSNAGERYLAIYGSDLSSTAEHAYAQVTVTSLPAGPVVAPIYSGRDGHVTIRTAPTGKLKIEVQGLPGATR